MPRIAWSRLVILLLALPLASCSNDEGTCPTCPPDNSGRIEVVLALNGEADSLHVNVDGGDSLTVRRGRRVSFEGLSAGAHSVKVRRYFEAFDFVTSRASSVEIRLEQGEARVIVFHNDFPLVADASVPGHAPAALAARPAPRRVG